MLTFQALAATAVLTIVSLCGLTSAAPSTPATVPIIKPCTICAYPSCRPEQLYEYEHIAKQVKKEHWKPRDHGVLVDKYTYKNLTISPGNQVIVKFHKDGMKYGTATKGTFTNRVHPNKTDVLVSFDFTWFKPQDHPAGFSPILLPIKWTVDPGETCSFDTTSNGFGFPVTEKKIESMNPPLIDGITRVYIHTHQRDEL